MPKAPRTTPEQDGEISFTMVKFTMKGSDTSMQKGMDAIKSAFVQAGFIPTLPDTRGRPNGAKQFLAAASDPEPEEADKLADPVETEAEIAEVPAAPGPKRPAAPRKAPNFKVIKDLKFDDVSPSLSEFVDEKDPQSTLDRYLCIAYWFKHTKGVEDLTTEHFFSAYMTYRWPMPANAATPIADLRHQKRQLMVSGAAPGTYTINNPGERRVAEMGKAT